MSILATFLMPVLPTAVFSGIDGVGSVRGLDRVLRGACPPRPGREN